LAKSSPLLSILVVNYARSQTLSSEDFEHLLALKRGTTLENVGLSGSKSLVRLVNRIELTPLLPWEPEDVIKVLKQPELLALLRHHPDLHLNHLRLLLRQRYPL
jgi:hypothetical protein